MSARLTVFYDSHCPLCVKEMRRLAQRDRKGWIALQDINQPDFSRHFPHVDPVLANKVLHGVTEDGRMLLGLDVTHAAWRLVGLGWLVAPLRWPVIRPLADRAYLWFAANRYRVSRWLTGSARCRTCRIEHDPG
ncbi:thiol-disulfide oxidoreductase DCC family protein [Ferrimonas marina]|uniref:Predicted thiol-disulfide oxidoreductase YuxK, DCC family n=1 Tax=Ferrimonas marina TaxID=299255 RepID=A0A1M5MZJ4_9GAMM|nr:DUF393 domain-containing protein [Ferrimonas marina]SHG82359.1 Predicted thiol-disulfide oxidoreductase YuxK, DCC family [Ferrimonas marina]